MMTVESAEALILVMMDSLMLNQDCLGGALRDPPRELLTEAPAVLGAMVKMYDKRPHED